MIEASHTMPSGIDCAGMMKAHKPASEHPCKGLTLACIAQMGCVVPMTVVESAPIVERAVVARLAVTRAAPIALPGLEIAPEPEPPAV